jgi:hypothetical protein
MIEFSDLIKTMKHKIASLIIIITLATLPSVSFAMRCGNKLINPGDLKHEVQMKCGKPYSRETIGYIDKEKDGDRIRVMKVEEWIIESAGNYYSLVFEGNKLAKIETAGSK